MVMIFESATNGSELILNRKFDKLFGQTEYRR
jgi:hypothetical protein